jgi:hypothetical protein
VLKLSVDWQLIKFQGKNDSHLPDASFLASDAVDIFWPYSACTTFAAVLKSEKEKCFAYHRVLPVKFTCIMAVHRICVNATVSHSTPLT